MFAERTDRARAVVLVALLLLVAACASKGRQRVGFDQLDENKREGIEAYREGGARWQRAVELARTDPNLARFLADNIALELVRQFEAGRLSKGGAALSPYERARRALVDLGAPAVELLDGMLTRGDDVVAGVAIDALAALGVQALPSALAPLRASASESRSAPASVRRRAAELAGRLAPLPSEDENELARTLSATLSSDPEWFVRAEAAKAAGRRARGQNDLYAPVLALGLGDRDPAVVGAAAQGLGELGDVRAIPALIGALDRMVGEVAAFDRVQRALQRLLGEQRPHTTAQWRRLWTERSAELLRRQAESAAARP